MIRISELLLNFGLNAGWQMLVIFSVASVGSYFLRNAAARYRYWLWLVTLALSVLGPLWSIGAFSPAQARSPTTDINSAVMVSNPAPKVTLPVETAAEPVTGFDRLVTPRQQVVNATRRGLLALGILYLLIVSVRVIRVARQWHGQHRLRQSATRNIFPQVDSIARRCETAMGLKRVSIGRSAKVAVPATLGVRNPMIVLPERLCAEADQEILMAVIGHEMAHVSRRDFTVNFVCELVTLPISFHPLTFLIRNEIHRNRELACDELVTQRLLAPQAYARSLVRVANATVRPAEALAVGLFGGDALEERIMRLTKRRKQLALRLARPIMATALGVLAAVVLSITAFSFNLKSLESARNSGPALPGQVFPERLPAAENAERVTTIKNDLGQSHRPLLDSQSAEERARAACDAGRKNAIEAIPTLISLLGDDRRIEPLQCWEFGSWSPALGVFKHPSPGEQSAIALASIGTPAFAPLVNQLTNQNAAVRRNAAWAIGELHNMPPGTRAGAVPGLLSLLNDTDEWVRMAAARALGELRDANATDPLVLTLSDSDWRVQQLAAWALGEMKDPRGVQGLCQTLLQSTQLQVRREAANALGEIRGVEALPALKQALDDPESSVRDRVAWAISEIEGE